MHWQTLLQKSITQPAQLFAHFGLDSGDLDRMTEIYPMRINPYYLRLIKQPGDPLWRQAVPDLLELDDTVCMEDPLNEEDLSPVPNLVHKYPDRALFLVHNQCAVYCRFCTRKRKVGTKEMLVSLNTINAGLKYLQQTPEIKDVLVSGGDPLLLDDNSLDFILSRIRAIRHIDIIRIGTRVPCTLPMRVTKKLAATIKRYHPLYINTHFNHPDEFLLKGPDGEYLTNPNGSMKWHDDTRRAMDAVVSRGWINVENQAPIIKGINDDADALRVMQRALYRVGVGNHYFFCGRDIVAYRAFNVPIETAWNLLN